MRRSRPATSWKASTPSATNGYARVLSWIDVETSGIIRAGHSTPAANPEGNWNSVPSAKSISTNWKA
jgi:hypothetical protein